MERMIKLEGRVLVPTQKDILFTNTLTEAFWACYNEEYQRIPIFPVKENPKNKNEL